MGDDYGYFGSGSSGYAHYQQTFKSCFGGSSGSDGGHHNNEPDWSNLLTLLKIGVLIVVPLYWTVTALHIAFYDLASIEPITILIDLFGPMAFCYSSYNLVFLSFILLYSLRSAVYSSAAIAS